MTSLKGRRPPFNQDKQQQNKIFRLHLPFRRFTIFRQQLKQQVHSIRVYLMYYPTVSAPVYPTLASCMAVLAVMGCVLQTLSLFMLTRPSFRQFDLTPYFLSVVLGNLMVIVADLPPLVASAWFQKQLVGIAYCQVQNNYQFFKLRYIASWFMAALLLSNTIPVKNPNWILGPDSVLFGLLFGRRKARDHC